MENVEIAERLSEVADLLEIQEANPFRVRAYRNAVRTIEGLTRSLAEMVEEGEDLTELSGIGEDISGYITEMVETGEFQLLRDLHDEVPPTVADLLDLEGIGPKKAKKLWEELDIETVDDLEDALDGGRVVELEGFGQKTAEKLRQAIEDFREHRERFRLGDADRWVEPLLEYMGEAPGVEELDVAGSYRRRKETVGDIDLLVACDDAGPVMEHFTSYDLVERVIEAGETRGSVVLRPGLQVDLRILPGESYGAALQYFTGSLEHNVKLRKRALDDGLRVSEYGVFEIPEGVDPDEMEPGEGERVAGETEEGVYEALGLVWMPPELREDRGEIEAAGEDELPDLVELSDIRGDLQMHSTWSDGKNTIETMARACQERGYEYMAITDHSRRVSVAGGLDEDELEEQWKEIDGFEGDLDIEILRSLEVDILKDGSLDLDDEHLEKLDLVLVSVHSYMDLDGAEQTERIVTAVSHPAVHVLAHPTGRRINERQPYDLDVEAVLEAAREHDVAVELNANPERLDLSDRHVFRARELGVPVVISTDAHSTDNLRYMEYGVAQARRGWLEPDDVLNTRSLSELKKWLDRE
ncbi:MAG: DNA polymerase/3'-5' exonuclease PolX [Candidatus Palauibacterales bacterium]|nr:DNA polymerase/3'-5' exonuclease PolX [Candidatus Palauibacterales bacterium]